jgi:nucleolar complex protein 3
MIKEKRFNVHPSFLSYLLHLLKTELSVRSSESKTDRPEYQKKAHSKGRAAARQIRCI